MAITFNNVHKTLRQKHKKTKVFQDAHATFEADKIIGVLASAGTGKTTAAHLATGKLRPDLGRVHRSSLVSFPVGGGGVFNGLLTGRENLAFLCRVFGFDPRPIIKFVIDFADLGRVIDKPFRLYNRDERTRLMFTSCYAIPFDTYIVDESMIGGRGQFRESCEKLARERMETAGFVIFSSSSSLLRKYCNEFYVIEDLSLHKVASLDEAVAKVGDGEIREAGAAADEGVAESVDSYDSLL